MRGYILFMGMSVNHRINIIRVGRYGSAGPFRQGAVRSQVTHQKHIVGSFFTHPVSSFLQCFVQFQAAFVLQKAIDKSPVFILKIFGCGTGQGLGCRCPDKSHLFVSQRQYFVRRQHQFPGLDINQVGTIITAFHPRSKL